MSARKLKSIPLAALAGDAGARAVLRDAAAAVVLVPVADPGVIYDLDIPSDFGGCA